MKASSTNQMSDQKEKEMTKDEKNPIENYGKLIQSPPSRQFVGGSSSSSPRPHSSLINFSTHNRFFPLSRTYNQALLNLPPSPLLKTPEKPVEKSPYVAQSSPSSPSPSPLELYIQKSITIPIIIVEPEFGQPNASLGQIVDKIFLLKIYFFQNPSKAELGLKPSSLTQSP